jgi:hypothetical protein
MTNFILVYIILTQINKTTVQVMFSICFLVLIDFSIILELCSICKDSNSHSQGDELMRDPGSSKAVKEYITPAHSLTSTHCVVPRLGSGS